MTFFSMVFGIVTVVMIAQILSARYRALGQQAEAHTSNSLPHSVQSIDQMRAQDEIRQLKERVAVLERVITDHNRSIDLDREIDRLRDR